MLIDDPTRPAVGSSEWAHAETIWDFHQLGHTPAAADVIVALGCHDIGVADTAADLYLEGLAPVVVATGAETPGSSGVLGGGEAVVFRERMIARGVPAAAILTETTATNTGENFTASRALIAAVGIHPASVLVACMPYMERRALATCEVQWPDVTARCCSSATSFTEYVELMWRRDAFPTRDIITNMVGDLDRVFRYPELGFASEQPRPPTVVAAFGALVDAGYGAKTLDHASSVTSR